ncbi:hypothetical protein [Photobacterium rosenbergii]|uniref:Uncharacterized protein n=1 Tax=Photobacterium rosenbergii TaxID=294936 RepID=A0ABU3ZK13_9GAMM|nr:hypothetical protein [Photobacterium rosenbergii]MDV5170446.1 hypothetical protein [Photobacterium rosenbergii]
MNYIAIFLNEKGKAVSDNIGQCINIQIGEFDDIHQATNSARELFGGFKVQEGLIWCKSRCGGVLIAPEPLINIYY